MKNYNVINKDFEIIFEGEFDDLAIACVLAMKAAEISTYRVPQTNRRSEIRPVATHAYGATPHASSLPFGVKPR